MKRRRLLVWLTAATALALAAYLLWPRPPAPAREPVFELAQLLGQDDSGFARAIEPRDFEFPRDHGPHPDYRNEWWYFTGNLTTPDGRPFGFEFTVFRFALSPEPIVSASAWVDRQVYMAHLALTDIAGERFYAHERFARGGLDLAGARAQPLAVWVGDWRIVGVGDGDFAVRLEADAEDFALDLRLEALVPPVLQGEEGLSRKGPSVGNASYYYSLPRLAVRGQLRVDGSLHPVRGQAWLDREWGSGALERGQEGWDWFALQFEDGSALMLYQLRRQSGEVDRFSAGTWIAPDGRVVRLAAVDFALEPLCSWRSPATGVRYPLRWRVRIPRLDAELVVAPRLPAQELDLSVRYWEGAVEASGRLKEEAARALGYMELTGYERE